MKPSSKFASVPHRAPAAAHAAPTTELEAIPATMPEAFDAIDAILDDMRTRYDETPQWEFCEGFMAALICSRRAIPASEYLEMLLGVTDGTEAGDAAEAGALVQVNEAGETTVADGEGSFADDAQKQRFMEIWNQRWAEVAAALDKQVESLNDEDAYQPEVLDVRGAVAELSEAERAEMAGEELPSFAQVWALGFMFVVENWPEEWAAPREKEAAKWLDSALQSMVALTEDDTDAPTLSPFTEDGPPTMSVERFNAFADAVWSVYDMREIWRGIGPRVQTLKRPDTPGRNDPCFCGSGKKYKKCHGA